MRSHMTAFGVGAGLSLLVAAVFALVAPRIADAVKDEDGVHVVNIGHGESGSFKIKEDALNVEADWKGDFAFAADGRTLTSLSGKLEVNAKSKAGQRKAIFEKRDGSIVATAFLDGKEIPSGEAEITAASDLLQLFAQSSGVNAESRVKAMMNEGGKERVIAEIRMLKGAHAVSAYVETLAEMTTLSKADIASLLDSVRTLNSDYAKRNAISALVRTQALDDQTTGELLEIARTIDGDHEIRLIVEELAESGFGKRNLDLAADLIGEIDNDHEIRLAISSILESDNLSMEAAARALDIAAKTIEGDYELRLAIEAAEEKVRSPNVGEAALRAAEKIVGDHDRRLAVEEIAEELDDRSALWPELIGSAAKVGDDYERRLALEAISSSAPRTDEIRAALRDAAETISSEHERRLALESLN